MCCTQGQQWAAASVQQQPPVAEDAADAHKAEEPLLRIHL
jgi:hypothetical protein